ncbi:STAS domain-containing protein [bacterium]|nr:STAS domain-containing protein [bacterium]
MKINISEKNDVVIITLMGEMVGGPDASLLAEKLHDLIAENRKKVAVNMAEIRWMNSSGLGLLIGGLNTIRSAGGDLKLFALTEKPRHLLKITQLDKVFDICDTEEEVIEKFV